MYLILSLCLFFLHTAHAQKDKVYQGLILDEVMVKAVAGGFDVDGFIQKVKTDTTFYKAFKSLRLQSFTLYNDIEIFDKSNETKASYTGISRQSVVNQCRTMQIKSEQIKGDYFTSHRNYRYYTAKLYAHLFFTQGKICNETNIVGNGVQKGSSKYEEQLRTLIFNPGQRISGIPGIGDNVAIFESPYVEKYNFKLSKVDYNGEECYVFRALPKPAYKDEVVINDLKTWFRASDFAIVARDYSLSYKTWIYDFDVEMSVKLKKHNTFLVPYEIHYKGNWHAITKPREIARFTAIFTDFE